jgi:hypothetical protein
MLKEIEELRRSLLALDALDDDTRDALIAIEAALEDLEKHPASGEIRGVLSDTSNALGDPGMAAGAGLSDRWEDLKKHFAQWEEKHPSLVLSVGRISNSLAAFGL